MPTTQLRREREKAEFRSEVLRAARKIVIRDGFDALSMRKIAESIEYSPGTIYLYFESRDAIAKALCQQSFVELVRALAPAAAIKDPRKRLEKFGELYVRFGLEHAESYRLVFMEDAKFSTPMFKDDHDDRSPGQQALGFLIAAFEELKAQKRIPTSANCAELADLLWVSVHGIVSLKLTCPEYPETSTDRLTRLMSNALLDGIIGRE